MAASISLTCLLLIFPDTRVNAYNKLAVKPIRVYEAWSGQSDGDKSYASCPSSSSVLVSCGLVGSHPIDGSYPSNGPCVAQNGLSGSGVIAIALCASNDYTCTYHSTSQSDVKSTVGCTDEDEVMVSCSPRTNSNSIHGAYVGAAYESTNITSSTLCTAHSEDGSDVWAEGICCKYNGNDGYQLDCQTEWGGSHSGVRDVAKCDNLGYGWTMWGCSGYSPSKDNLRIYKPIMSQNVCNVESQPIQAIATCCRLYQPPSEDPTTSPTPGPTLSPTSSTSKPTNVPTDMPTKTPTKPPTTPTSSPTVDPTVNPTVDPSSSPTKNPTVNPSVDPTVEPTLSPTEHPTISPTNAPILKPSHTPTQGQYDVGTERATAFDWSDVTYIGVGVCIGCVIYGFIVCAKKRLRTDPNPRASSLDKTHPPSIATMSVPGAAKSSDPVCKDNDGSESSHGLYDVGPYHTPVVGGEIGTPGSAEEDGEKSIVFDSVGINTDQFIDIALVKDEDGLESSDIDSLFDDVDPNQTTTVDDKRMTSLPLPDLPREASGMSELSHDKGNDADDHDLCEEDMPSKQISLN